jgi:hypothetical protein
MARAKSTAKDMGGGAARVAARRRDAPSWKANETPSRGVDKSAARAGASSRRSSRSSARGGALSGVAKLGKLTMLVVAMVAIGFFAILVVDVGAHVVGKVRLGEVTVVDLWHKVVDRVLDRDVPHTTPVDAAPSAPAHVATHAHAPAPATRAPVQAAKPEEDARHVDVERPDPEVERARQRLDEILGRAH